jgi:hypothetical protein
MLWRSTSCHHIVLWKSAFGTLSRFLKQTPQRSSFRALEIIILPSAYALGISIMSSMIKNLLGAPEVHPMGVAPEL